MKKFILALIPFLFFSVVLFNEKSVFHELEFKTIDWRFQLQNINKNTDKIVLVTIDEKSLHREGRWPWHREKIASLLDAINKASPKLIGLDIIFAEPAPGDKTLYQTINRNRKTILGYYFYNQKEELEKAEFSANEIEKNFQTILPSSLPQLLGNKTETRQMQGVVANLPELAKGALTQGFFNTLPDKDGVIRKMPLFLNYKGHVFPALTLSLFSQYLDGFAPLPIRDTRGFLMGLSIKNEWIPTNSKGEMWIHYHGHQKGFTTISATDLLRGEADTSLIKDKIVMVGATAIGIYDLRVSPLSPVTPGVFIQAEALDTLLRRDFLNQNFETRILSWLAMFALTTLIYWIFSRNSLLLSLAISILLTLGYVAMAFVLFQKNMILSMVAPTFNSLTVAFALISYRGLTEEVEKRRIRKIFQSYLHPSVIKEIVDSPNELQLGGKRVTGTILFSDVRDFTTISEKMDPVTLLELMNAYFDPISRKILKYSGYIDKFIGDAVMAVFGIPLPIENHAFKACQTALEMKAKAEELEPLFKTKYGIDSFKIGIGIHTGPVIAGNIGTQERLNYTVMGDAVNLAARLEGATKNFKVTILISETTFSAVADKIATRYVDEIKVKGRAETVRVYEVLGLKENGSA